MNSTDAEAKITRVKQFLAELKKELDLILGIKCPACDGEEFDFPTDSWHICVSVDLDEDDLLYFDTVIIYIKIPLLSAGRNTFLLRFDEKELDHYTKINKVGEYKLILINQLLNRVGDSYHPLRQVYTKIQSYMKDAAENEIKNEGT